MRCELPYSMFVLGKMRLHHSEVLIILLHSAMFFQGLHDMKCTVDRGSHHENPSPCKVLWEEGTCWQAVMYG